MAILLRTTLLLLCTASNFVFAQNVTTEAQATERVGWVANDTTRSTSQIIFCCVSIFLVCSWECVHLNIPSIEESEAGWYIYRGWLYYWPTAPLRRLWFRRLGWVALIAIAPEIGVAVAFEELMEARKTFRRYKHLGFTMPHAFYACMGGYRVAIPRTFLNQDGDTRDGPTLMAGTVQGDNENHQILVKDTMVERMLYYSPQLTTLEILDELGIFPATEEACLQDRGLPLMKEEDIHNVSTSDAVIKGFACLQCVWLISLDITRAAAGLPISELELMTLAFIFCALIMYGLWWYKPFGVQRATLILPPNQEKANIVQDRLGPPGTEGRSQGIGTVVETWLDLPRCFLFDPFDWKRSEYDEPRSIICNLTSLVFSGFHLVAWNWEFPSDTTRMLWRIFSLTATGAPLVLMSISGILLVYYATGSRVRYRAALKVVMYGMSIIYTISRLGLIILVFYCFSSMPAAVYKTEQWCHFFPHFA